MIEPTTEKGANQNVAAGGSSHLFITARQARLTRSVEYSTAL